MEKIRYCEVCGVSSTNKKVSLLKSIGILLCDKHKSQYKKYGEFKDNNPRSVFDNNEIRILDNHAEIDTYDSYGNVVETYILDIGDIDKLKNHKWRTVYKNNNTKPYLFTGNQKSEKIYFHRLVCPTELQVDHINGNTLDNRKSNLRPVSQKDNLKNMNKKSTNTSGFRGVSFNTSENKWMVDFIVESKRYYFKKFIKLEEAVYLRYLLENIFYENFRYTKNDKSVLEFINKLTITEKTNIKEYLINKLNISKDRVEKI